MTTKKNAIFFISIVVSVTAFFYLSLIPLNLSNYIEDIENAFEKQIDGDLSIGSAEMYPLPFPRIKAESIKLTKDGKTIVNAEMLSVNISLLPLIFKKIDIKSLKLTNGNILIKRDKEGTINLQKKNNQYSKSKQESFTLSLNSFHTINSSILLIDEFHEPKKSHSFKNLDLHLYPLPNGFNYTGKGLVDKATTFSFSGTGSRSESKTTLTGILEAHNIILKKYKQLISDNTGGIETTGTANIESTYSFDVYDFYHSTGIINGNLAYTGLDIAIPTLFKNKFHSELGSAKIDFNWAKDSISVAIENVTLDLPEFNMFGDFTLDKIGKDKEFTLKLKTNSAPYKYLKDFIPIKGIPKKVAATIDKIVPTGGEFELNEFMLSMKLGNKKENIKSTLNKISLLADFHDFVFEYELFNNEPAVINGKIGLDIIPYKYDIQNKTVLKKVNVSFNNVAGLIDNSSITITGTIEDTIDTAPQFDFIGEANLTHSALTNLFSRAHLDVFKYNKHAKFKGTLTGPLDHLSLKSNIDLSNTDIGLPGPLRKNTGTHLELQSIINFEPEGVTLDEGTFIAGDSHIIASGRLGRDGYKSYLELRSDNLLVKDGVTLIEALDDNFPSQGNLSLNIKSVRENETSEPTFDGKITIENGLLKPVKNIYPLSNINGHVNLTGKTGKVFIETLTAGEKTTLSGKIDIINSAKGLIDFNLISEYFDLEDVMTNIEKESVASVPFFTGKGKLSIQEGNFIGVSFNNFYTDVTLDKQTVRLEPINVVSNEGIITGNLNYYRVNLENKLFDAHLKLRLAELESLFKDLGAKDKILSGKVEGDIILIGRPVPIGKSITSGLDGLIKIHSENGTLWKFNTISKIFSLTNISFDDLFEKGLIYNDIKGKFKIEQGILTPSHFFFDSSSMRITAAGNINIPENRIEAQVGVHPFVNLDKIIKNIPFAGWVITGPDGSTVSMYYEVTGPVGDPKVEAIPVKALGEGIGNMFKRILEAPEKTFKNLNPS